jgi:lipopolysaccharide/colanic/teichoic acid biosynthesis glycosyltransferase
VKFTQRAFNMVAAAVGLFFLSPLLAAAAVAVKCNDGGPVLYAQPRVGKHFRTFRLWKFRSMVPEADRAGLLTEPGDRRVTRAGRFLRKYKLDELPQLWNVLIGEMQLVGVRPEVKPYVEMFHEQYAALLEEPPGITDPASLAYRNESQLFIPAEMEQHYISKILPDKLRLSLEYQRRRTFASDLGILLHTLRLLAI